MKEDDDSTVLILLMIFGGFFFVVAIGIIFVILQYRKINSTPSSVAQMSNGGSTYSSNSPSSNSTSSNNSGISLPTFSTVSDAPLRVQTVSPQVVTSTPQVTQYTSPPPQPVDKQKPIKDVLNRRIQIINFNKQGLCLDNNGGRNGTQMHYWNCDQENQQFVFEPITSGSIDGPYKLREMTKTTCMDDDGGYSYLISYDCGAPDRQNNQKFKVGDPDVNGFGSITIESASKPGYCFHDGGGGKESGWKLQPCNKDDPNQQFFLKPF